MEDSSTRSGQPCKPELYSILSISQQFGTSGRQEHHQIRLEDLEHGTGRLIQIEWIKGPTKTRQGGLNKKPRMVIQKLFRTGGNKCPVACLEKLFSKRPEDLADNGLIYLCPLHKERNWTKEPIWFSHTPIGVSSINSFMQRMANKAGLDVTKNTFTNHSIRKTTLHKLKKAGVNANISWL